MKCCWLINNLGNSLENQAFILFFQKRKIFQVIVLGEMDRAESSYEAMCFVTELEEEEFISSDAMSKLRQVSFLNHTRKQHLLQILKLVPEALISNLRKDGLCLFEGGA